MANELKVNERIFWSKVVKGEGCWLWTAVKNRKGYGRINVKGEVMLAHRISFALSNPGSEIQCVLHKCDNPSCVNPDHLFTGTIQDNNKDMIDKGRASYQIGTLNSPTGKSHGRYTKPQSTARGERNGSSTIPDYEVNAMKTLFSRGLLSQRLISKAFNIHISTANRIVNNKTRQQWQTS